MALDFPSSPTNGQVYNNYYYNSARGAWNALLPAATPNFFTNATLNTSTLIDATATASVTSVTPLIVKSLSGQTTNIQSWQESSTILAGINQYGGFYTTNRLTVGASTISTSAIAHINTINAGNVGLLVKGSTSQTANLQEWQNSSGTVLSYVDSAGNINFSGSGSFVQSSTGRALFATNAAATTPLTVKAAASQTADIQQWQSSTGAVLSEINSAGELQVPRIGVGATMPTTTRLMSTASAATEVPIIARGAASQTAVLQAWQDSAGTVLASIEASGRLMSTAEIRTDGKIVGTTQPNNGSDGGVAVRAPASGTQTSGFLQFVNNAYTAQWASLEATPSSELKLNATYIKMPNQPTFFAYQPESGTYQQNGGIIIFGSTQLNTGSAYNTSNGRFTAPIAGIYQLNAMILCRSNTNPGEATFFKNGANIISRNMAYSNPVGTNAHDPVHFMTYLSLAAGDYVDVRTSVITSGDWYFGGGLGWFSGRLVG